MSEILLELNIMHKANFPYGRNMDAATIFLVLSLLLTVEVYPFQFREILIERGPIEKFFPHVFGN